MKSMSQGWGELGGLGGGRADLSVANLVCLWPQPPALGRVRVWLHNIVGCGDFSGGPVVKNPPSNVGDARFDSWSGN